MAAVCVSQGPATDSLMPGIPRDPLWRPRFRRRPLHYSTIAQNNARNFVTFAKNHKQRQQRNLVSARFCPSLMSAQSGRAAFPPIDPPDGFYGWRAETVTSEVTGSLV